MSANHSSYLEQPGHELGTEHINAVSQFCPEYRRDVVAGFSVALTPFLEAGIAAIRERK